MNSASARVFASLATCTGTSSRSLSSAAIGTSYQPRFGACTIAAVVVDDAGRREADAQHGPVGQREQVAAQRLGQVDGRVARPALERDGQAVQHVADEGHHGTEQPGVVREVDGDDLERLGLHPDERGRLADLALGADAEVGDQALRP